MLGQERLISMARGKGTEVAWEEMRVWQARISEGEPVTLMMNVFGGVEEDGSESAREDMMERYSDSGRGL